MCYAIVSHSSEVGYMDAAAYAQYCLLAESMLDIEVQVRNPFSLY